jgi:type II secretory pathway pseudopilin PulG
MIRYVLLTALVILPTLARADDNAAQERAAADAATAASTASNNRVMDKQQKMERAKDGQK